MVARSVCSAIAAGGGACTAPALKDGAFCLWHDPARADEVAEARRLGGLRRRREQTIEGAYDLEGLENVPQIRRLLQIATTDALGLESSVARVRVLIHLVAAATKLLEVGELEQRLASVEGALGPRLQRGRR